MRPGTKGGSTSRPFSWALALLALALGSSAVGREASLQAPAGPTVAIAAPGGRQLALLDCASGRIVASAASPDELVADLAADPDGRAVYASLRSGMLLRYSLPDLREQARVALDFEATVLAVGSGPDAVVLAGGHGIDAMSAHDPASLVEAHRFRLAQPFAVAAMRDVPARRRFVVAFTDLAEAWEVAYGRDAPPVLQGLVHDYRSNEAVPLPGRFTPRRFELPRPTRALIAGPAPFEVARLDDAGALGIVKLDVRREIERPGIGAVAAPERVAPWRSEARRGWLIAGMGASSAEVLEVSNWKVSGRFDADGEMLALVTVGDRVLVATSGIGGTSVSLVDVARRAAEPLASGIAAAPLPLRFVQGDGCVALVDRDRRWLAGFVVPAPGLR